MKFLDEIKFAKDGLVPVIIQEQGTEEVLMMAYMNRESLKKTLKDKKTCFWSRSRKKFWTKGETSGNFQVVRGIYLDCDGDTILIKVEQKGKAVACHTGYKTCFFRKLESGKVKIVGRKKG
ncbi:MAG: phosphoribosyl-AMP cyclohydrolase [bacterium]